MPVGITVAILKKGTDIIYIFEIQQSSYSPHQYQNIYNARLDGQTKIAPHYLIEALFKKIHFPNIEGFITFDNISHNGMSYSLYLSIFLFNFSELQNEEKVSFRVLCTQGIFANSHLQNTDGRYNMEGHQLIYTNFAEILHYGEPHVHREHLIINASELASKNSNKLYIILTFGGKKSPSKFSSYTLDFNKINWNTPKKLAHMILVQEENILFAEKQTQGRDKEGILKEILNR